MTVKDYQYQVYGPSGDLLLQATEECRYTRKVEKEMLEAGYTIRLHGKRLSKTEIKKEAQSK